MPTSLALQSYLDHQTAAALHNGGESAEWPELANALAARFLTELSAFPLERPLRNAWGYPVLRPNGDWPNLVVVHVQSVPVRRDSVYWQWTHHAAVVLICGPWLGGDPATMQALGTPYIDPLVDVLDADPSLGGRCHSIKIGADGLRWQVLTYGPGLPPANQWYGLTLPLELTGTRRRVWGP